MDQRLLFSLPILVLLFISANTLWADEQASDAVVSDDRQVMQAFTTQDIVEGEAVAITTKEKHSILFYMGMTLLVLLIATAVLGVAMGVYNKDVFVPHMVLAGLSVTLAIAHSVVAVVWFYPF